MPELFGPCDYCGKRFKTLRGLVNHPCSGKKKNRPRGRMNPEAGLDDVLSLGP